MCGICGAASVDPLRPIERGLLRGMLERLAHRGPDGEGFAFPRGAALGHRRLAVIDLSEAAAQPLSNEDGTVLAVVNGEIYNHRELRTGLEAKGHRFRSRSDVEVLVHLYEDLGPDAVGSLEGMFAFALWDERADRLLLGRDTVGEKPLYYHETAERILFASELGALLADPSLDPEPDEDAIQSYLTFRFVPSPATGLSGVFKLPPGHLMIWERGRRRIERYSAVPGPEEARALRRSQDRESSRVITPMQVRDAVGRAVAGRLESDVPIGVLLSGGLDSAIVAFEAARASPVPLQTFTIGFEEIDYDETEQAAEVARCLGSQHHAVRLRPDLASELPRMVAHYGEPFGDSSAAAVWFLAREVRRHVTVALGGDGGDELFGGYDRHRAIRLQSAVSAWGARPFAAAAARLASYLPAARRRRSVLTRFESFARELVSEPLEANAAWLSCFKTDEIDRLLGRKDGAKRASCSSGSDARSGSADGQAGEGWVSGARRGLAGGRIAQSALATAALQRFCTGARDPLEDVLYADLVLGLPDRLLFKVDVASMASALEVRSPFLDRDLVRLAMAIPSARKVGWRQGKLILREAYEGLLPEVVLRGRKRGFGLPIDRWLRGTLGEMARDLLLSPRATSRGRFDTREVSRLLDSHHSGASNEDDRIWALLCLELWLREVVEGRARSAPASHAVAS